MPTLRMLLRYLELNSCNRYRMAHSLKYLLFGPLHTMFADPCSKSYLSLLAALLWIAGPVLQAITWPDF